MVEQKCMGRKVVVAENEWQVIEIEDKSQEQTNLLMLPLNYSPGTRNFFHREVKRRKQAVQRCSIPRLLGSHAQHVEVIHMHRLLYESHVLRLRPEQPWGWCRASL